MITQSRVRASELVKYKQQTEDIIKVCDKKIKTIHEEGWNIDEYCKIFEIPKEKQVEIKDWLFSVTEDFDGDIIRILCPGVGGGRNELYMISVLADKYSESRIICDFIDHSKDSCDYLRGKILPEKGYIVDLSGWKFCKDNIEINIYEEDYESWLNSVSNVDDKYDLILSFFLFNFLSNWRKSILKTIELLDDDGVLVVSQDLGDICYLDNTCYDVPEKNDSVKRHYFYDLWNDYYDLRNEYGLDWNNLISPSNMIFVDNVFNDISRITNDDIYNSKDFFWKLSDLSDESKNKFVKLNFWMELIKGKDKSDIIFNCLSIPDNIRDVIAKTLMKKYSDKEVIDLKLGEKLFALKRTSRVSNFMDICRYALEKNYFNVELLGAYRFKNRRDIKVEEDIEIKDIKYSLLNRALDIYNCYIHNKSKSMVSLFSKKVEKKGLYFDYTWRKSDTPIICPSDFNKDDIKNFAISYATYFYYREYEEKYKGKITSLVHDKFPERVGLIFNIEDRIEKHDIEPIYYKNKKEIKAFYVTISRERFRKCQEVFKDIINNLSDKAINDIVKNYIIDVSNKKNYIYTESIVSIMENLNIHKSKLNQIDSLLECNDVEFLKKVRFNVCQYYDEEELSSEFKDNIVDFFKSVYMIALSHPVDANIIMYTTTNIDYDYDDDKVKREKSYYGLIIADSIDNKDIKYVSAYYDILLANTFSYSGMDGMHELKVKDEMIKEVALKSALSAIMSRNMSHNIGSHVLSSLVDYKKEFNEEKIKDFLRYLQLRIEFIADITTSIPLITTNVKLKSDVINGFISSEKENKVHGRFEKDNKPPEYLIRFISGSNDVTYDESRKNIAVECDDDLDIAVPNYVFGMQALYIMLENLIRNASKHGVIPVDKKGEKTLVFTIKRDVTYFDDDYEKFIIWDNLGKINIDVRKNERYKVYKSDKNKQSVDEVGFLRWIQHKIDREVLDETGDLRANDWGFLEMKICAAYLRKENIKKIEDKKSKRPLLNVIFDEDYNLGIEMFLMKTKVLCCIVGDKSIYDCEGLAKIGVDIYQIDEVDMGLLMVTGLIRLKKTKIIKQVSHTYLIIQDVFDKELVGDNNQITHVLSQKDIYKVVSSCNRQEIELELFRLSLVDYSKISIKRVDENTSDKINKNDLVFDSHGQYIKKNGEKSINSVYYECYDSKSPTNIMLKKFDSMNVLDKNIFKCELYQSAKISVGVVDERIQRYFISEVIDDEIKKYSYYKTSVFVPFIESHNRIDLYKNSFEKTEKGEIESWIIEYRDICDYIIIHIGIIEKVIGTTNLNDISKYINYHSEFKSKIIITSGRGRPSNIPNEIYYIPFSIIYQYIVKNTSKLYLYKLLISARKYHAYK